MDVHLYKAFPRNGKGGNPAGVLLTEELPSAARMAAIAKEVGFSETAFGSLVDEKTYRLRFFTPAEEVPLCGHATVAFLNHLRLQGKVAHGELTLKTAAGSFQAEVKKDSACIVLSAPKPTETIRPRHLATALDVSQDTLGPLPPTVVETGIKEVFVEVNHRRIVASLSPKKEKILTLCRKLGVAGVYVYAREPKNGDATTIGRNFLPAIGITEESATGTASVSLAALLAARGVRRRIYRFDQGDFMGEPSRIEVRLERDDAGCVRHARLCGAAVVIAKEDTSG